MISHTFHGPLFEMKKNIRLHELASHIIKSILPSAICRKSLIINDIRENIFLHADEDLVSIVLNSLLANTVSSSLNSCIRVSALQEYGETIVTVSDNNSDYSRYISGKMTKVQPIVKKMGGDLRFEFNKRNSITILLSFMDPGMVA